MLPLFSVPHAQIQRGGRGSGPPLKNHKNIGFLSTTGPDPLKITKLLSQHPCWVIIRTPAKRNLSGVSLAGRLWPANSGIWVLFPLIDKKQQQKNNSKKTLLRLTPYDTTFRIRACLTSSADRGLVEPYHLSTVMSFIRKVDKPPPPSIQVTHT